MWRRTAGSPERLADGAVVEPGDVIQVVYRADPGVQGAILSVDGRGVVTEHLPPGPLRPGPVPLDHAFELDDAPEYERFFLLIGTADALAGAGEDLAAGREPPEGRVAARFELRKR